MEEQPTTSYDTVSAPLNTLGPTLQDIPSGFAQIGEEHNTTPYVIEEGVLKDMTVLERYNEGFKQGEYTNVNIAMNRYESKEKCAEALTKITTTYRSAFTEVSGTTFGEESFFGINVTEAPEGEVTASFLVFRMADVLVVLSTVTSFDLDTESIGRTIERNISNVLT